MKTYKKTIEKPLLEIVHDESPLSPRERSNLGYFITVDRNYKSPDNEPILESIVKNTSEEASNQAEHIKLIEKEANAVFVDEKVLAVYPVVKYEHSAVSYSLGTVKGFDHSNNGFYIITDKTQKELGIKKKDWEKVINQELEVYNKYFNGEVYGFRLYGQDGELAESCYGFYAIDDIKDYLPEEWKNEELSEYVK